MQADEADKQVQKKVLAKHMLNEIFEANNNAILVKQKKALEIKEEEQRIEEYCNAKRRKEAEQQAELQRLKDEKEKEV